MCDLFFDNSTCLFLLMCDPFLIIHVSPFGWCAILFRQFYVFFFADVRLFSACDEYSLHCPATSRNPPPPPAPYPATLWPYFGSHPTLAQQMTNILDDPHHPLPHSLVYLIFHNVDFSGINQANDVVGSCGRGGGGGGGGGEQRQPMKTTKNKTKFKPNLIRK